MIKDVRSYMCWRVVELIFFVIVISIVLFNNSCLYFDTCYCCHCSYNDSIIFISFYFGVIIIITKYDYIFIVNIILIFVIITIITIKE